jgi:hypothetical protein
MDLGKVSLVLKYGLAIDRVLFSSLHGDSREEGC